MICILLGFLLVLDPEPALTMVVDVTNSEAVRIVGRVARVGDGGVGVRFDWPGTRFVASLRGTHLEVVLTEQTWTTGNMYDVEVDGASSVLHTRVGQQVTYTLATNLSAGSHLVSLTKRTEGGPAQLHWFSADGPGDYLPTPPKHRVLFIGDSICAGSGALGTINDCNVGDITLQSASAAFAMLSLDMLQAEGLQAEGHLVCISGKGIVRNWGEPREAWGVKKTMAVLWKHNLANDGFDGGNWDCSAWVPHVVVIHIGSNDYSTSNAPPTQEEYVNALLNLLSELWDACGDVHIPVILACGPLYGHFPIRYMSEVASKFENVQVADCRNGVFEDDLTMGCGCHPAYRAEKRIANILAPRIAAALQRLPAPTPAPSLVSSLPQVNERCNQSECGDGAWCSLVDDTCKAIGDACNHGMCGPGAWCNSNVCVEMGTNCNWAKCGTEGKCSVCDDKCYETCYHTATTCAADIPRKRTYLCDYSGHGGRPTCGVTNDQCAGRGDNFPCPNITLLANTPTQTLAQTSAPAPLLAITSAQTLAQADEVAGLCKQKQCFLESVTKYMNEDLENKMEHLASALHSLAGATDQIAGNHYQHPASFLKDSVQSNNML